MKRLSQREVLKNEPVRACCCGAMHDLHATYRAYDHFAATQRLRSIAQAARHWFCAVFGIRPILAISRGQAMNGVPEEQTFGKER